MKSEKSIARRGTMSLWFVMQLCFLLIAGLAGEGRGALEGDFSSPPEGTKPRCYWYWIDGQISKEGITRDLEAMKRVGIGEGYIGIIGGGKVKALTEPWWGMIEHAVREGSRIGVDVGIFNCPGWSQSGGPWIKPNQAMRYVVVPEVRVSGPKRFEGKLPAPTGEFQDIGVFAFPAPAGDGDTIARHGAKISAGATVKDVGKLFDGDVATACELPKGAVTIEVAEAFTARSLVIFPAKAIHVTCEVQTSEDGTQFKTVRAFAVDRHKLDVNVGPMPLAPVSVSLPAVKSRYFRLVFSGNSALGEIVLSSGARVESYAEKQLLKVFQSPLPPFDFYTWTTPAEPDSAEMVVKPQSVRQITQHLGADGVLRWEVPAGDWIILRAAMTPTGTKNSPAPPEATGLEVDKMNRTALRSHFEAYVGQLVKRIPAEQRTAMKHVVADSYEMGPQNWTDGFAEDFSKKYGYSPLPFLPVLSGRIVGSAEESDRFLWDVRRLVADRVSRDYVGGLRDLCHENGLKMWLENYGHWGFPGEFLQYGGECDEVSGEFWATGDLGSIELRDASSAAHIYGKPVTFAEAFTGGPLFTSHPGSLKARGDWSLCQGINQFVLHVYIHQPWDDRRPGVNAWFGTEFNRHNTWFEQGKAWIDYHRRCSVMLQHGKYVADVAYFIGEDTPKMAGLQQPALPGGYQFDYINAEVIENRLAVKDGRFVLPDGMSYRLLVLPESANMRPGVLKKIRDLVAAGGAVLGAPPLKSPSLQDYPKCDEQMRELAGELWKGCDGKTVTASAFGKGRVFRGIELQPALDQLSVPADLGGVDTKQILFVHRQSADADVYFLSNQNPQAVEITPSFRVSGMAPELWDAQTGRMTRPAVYDLVEGRVRLPIHLAGSGSVFVVFRQKADDARIVKVKGTGVELNRLGGGELEARIEQAGQYEFVTAGGKVHSISVQGLPGAMELTGGWDVTFGADSGIAEAVKFDRLMSWSEHADPRVKYFSGTAVYRKTFELPQAMLAKEFALELDLGNVGVMAEVVVNGKNLGTVWMAPWRVNISDAAKTGENTVEIRVVNVWHNRMVGQVRDAAALKGVHQPWSSMRNIAKNAALFPSGLMGPVSTRVVQVVKVGKN